MKTEPFPHQSVRRVASNDSFATNNKDLILSPLSSQTSFVTDDGKGNGAGFIYDISSKWKWPRLETLSRAGADQSSLMPSLYRSYSY